MGGGSSLPSMTPGKDRRIEEDGREKDRLNNEINGLRINVGNLNADLQNQKQLMEKTKQEDSAKIGHLKQIITADLGSAPPLQKPRDGQYYKYNDNLPDPKVQPPLTDAAQALLATNADPNNNTNLGLLSKIQFYNTYLKNYYDAFNKFFYSFDANENIIHNELEPQVQYMKNTALKGGPDLTYVMLKKQNNTLQRQTQENADTKSGDIQKIMYQNQKIENLQNINNWIFLIYYCILGVFLIYLFLYSQNAGVIMKIFILVLFTTYPFFITYVRQISVYYINYMSALIYGNPYSTFNSYTMSSINTLFVPAT